MKPTPELRQELRELLDEVIPEDGKDTDTRFTDAQIDRLLERARNIYAAAAEGWTRKAAMFQREQGGLQAYTAGQESYEMTKPSDMMEYALKMAEQYREMAAKTRGSAIIRLKPPKVL